MSQRRKSSGSRSRSRSRPRFSYEDGRRLREIQVSGVACGVSPALNNPRSRRIIPGPPVWPSSCMIGVVRTGNDGGNWECTQIEAGDHAWTKGHLTFTNAHYATLLALKMIGSAPKAEYTQNQIRLVQSARSAQSARTKLAIAAQSDPIVRSKMLSYYSSRQILHPTDQVVHEYEVMRYMMNAARISSTPIDEDLNILQAGLNKLVPQAKEIAAKQKEIAEKEQNSSIAETKKKGVEMLEQAKKAEKNIESEEKVIKQSIESLKREKQEMEKQTKNMVNGHYNHIQNLEKNAQDLDKLTSTTTTTPTSTSSTASDVPTEPNIIDESEAHDAAHEQDNPDIPINSTPEATGFGTKTAWASAGLTAMGALFWYISQGFSSTPEPHIAWPSYGPGPSYGAWPASGPLEANAIPPYGPWAAFDAIPPAKK